MSRGLLEISVLREAGEGTLWTLAFFAKSRPCHRAFNLQRQTWGLRGGEAHPEPSARRRQVWALDRVPWHATQSSLHSALEKPGRLLLLLVSLAADCCAPSPGGAQLVTLPGPVLPPASLRLYVTMGRGRSVYPSSTVENKVESSPEASVFSMPALWEPAPSPPCS